MLSSQYGQLDGSVTPARQRMRESAIVQLGDCLLQIGEPLDEESPLGRHVARWGNMIYCFTFRVNDLDAAQAWLNSRGVRTSRPRAGLLAADPADTFNAPYFFTTDVLDNDPFEI